MSNELSIQNATCWGSPEGTFFPKEPAAWPQFGFRAAAVLIPVIETLRGGVPIYSQAPSFGLNPTSALGRLALNIAKAVGCNYILESIGSVFAQWGKAAVEGNSFLNPSLTDVLEFLPRSGTQVDAFGTDFVRATFKEPSLSTTDLVTPVTRAWRERQIASLTQKLGGLEALETVKGNVEAYQNLLKFGKDRSSHAITSRSAMKSAEESGKACDQHWALFKDLAAKAGVNLEPGVEATASSTSEWPLSEGATPSASTAGEGISGLAATGAETADKGVSFASVATTQPFDTSAAPSTVTPDQGFTSILKSGVFVPDNDMLTSEQAKELVVRYMNENTLADDLIEEVSAFSPTAENFPADLKTYWDVIVDQADDLGDDLVSYLKCHLKLINDARLTSSLAEVSQTASSRNFEALSGRYHKIVSKHPEIVQAIQAQAYMGELKALQDRVKNPKDLKAAQELAQFLRRHPELPEGTTPLKLTVGKLKEQEAHLKQLDKLKKPQDIAAVGATSKLSAAFKAAEWAAHIWRAWGFYGQQVAYNKELYHTCMATQAGHPV